MTNDMERIKQLEKELGIKLKEYSLDSMKYIDINSFSIDNKERVTGLAFFHVNFERRLPILSKFKRLEMLNMCDNQIRDISSLKNLRGLTHLMLHDNPISDISSLIELKNL